MAKDPKINSHAHGISGISVGYFDVYPSNYIGKENNTCIQMNMDIIPGMTIWNEDESFLVKDNE